MRPAVQISLLAVLAAVGLASSDPTDNWKSLHVKWSAASVISYSLGRAYFTIPLTQANAQKEGWAQADSDDITTTWCLPNDPRFCVLYDQQGSIAGVVIGIPAADVEFEGNPYPIAQQPLFNKLTLWDTPVYAGIYYFVSQDTLKAGGRSSFTKLGNGLWLKSGNDLIQIPLNGTGLQKDSWTKENCIPEMGRHYYYNVSPETKCETFKPYFILTDNDSDEVHGVGFQTFGKASKKSRDWYETVPALAVKPTIPTTPQCLVDWTGKYGVISLHMYFTDRPWFILC